MTNDINNGGYKKLYYQTVIVFSVILIADYYSYSDCLNFYLLWSIRISAV